MKNAGWLKQIAAKDIGFLASPNAILFWQCKDYRLRRRDFGGGNLPKRICNAAYPNMRHENATISFLTRLAHNRRTSKASHAHAPLVVCQGAVECGFKGRHILSVLRNGAESFGCYHPGRMANIGKNTTAKDIGKYRGKKNRHIIRRKKSPPHSAWLARASYRRR